MRKLSVKQTIAKKETKNPEALTGATGPRFFNRERSLFARKAGLGFYFFYLLCVAVAMGTHE